jgi:micrococcal nuclease
MIELVVIRVLTVAALLGLLIAAPASATVRKVSLTSPVVAGSYASLTVTVAPRARCTIEVIYDTVVSSAKGLGPKTGSRITWRWRVGTSTHPGRWPIVVRCGSSGTLRLKLRVLPR